jgi:hypothetical protein
MYVVLVSDVPGDGYMFVVCVAYVYNFTRIKC